MLRKNIRKINTQQVSTDVQRDVYAIPIEIDEIQHNLTGSRRLQRENSTINKKRAMEGARSWRYLAKEG